MSLQLIKDQWLFPPKASFTEKDVPSQAGRVFIVTGGNSGIGFELCKMLYTTGARIYMACRNKGRALDAIKAITAAQPPPKDPGSFLFLPFDLNDLESVKNAAATFQQQESKLDVLWNNAGCGGNRVSLGQRTMQGFEPMIGMHLIATLLFTHLVHPELCAAVTASNTPGSVRVVWLSSIASEGNVKTHGIVFKELKDGASDRGYNYAHSKVGSWFLGREMGRRWASDGILSVALNPGNVKTNSYEGMPWLLILAMKPFLHAAKFGGYTELFAGLSPEITPEKTGSYIIPWGRIQTDEMCGRQDLIVGMKPEEEGGLGYAKKLWDWCEEQWNPYVA